MPRGIWIFIFGTSPTPPEPWQRLRGSENEGCYLGMKKEAFTNFWTKFKRAIHWDELSPTLRRTLVAVIGGTIVLIGIAMLVLPGPAVVVIPLGLAILASEFAWARRYVRKARELLENAKNKVAG